MKTIKIAHLYYDLMNLYGENGNIRFLKKKLEEQDVEVQIHFLTIDDKIDFNKYDFYYIGTGSEENQRIVLEDLRQYKDDINNAYQNNKFFLITGNSLELFGKVIKTNDADLDGLSIFDFVAQEENFRIVGEQYYQCKLMNKDVLGFQNRICTITDTECNLFDVVEGTGSTPNSKKEGLYKKNFYGTYLLGPILVRNPYFTDYLIKQICKQYDIDYIKPDYNAYCYKAYNEYLKNFYEK